MPMSIPPRPDLGRRPPVSRKVLMLGTCQLDTIAQMAAACGHHATHHLMETLQHSAVPDIDLGGFEAVVVSFTLRHIMAEATGLYFGAADMALARLADPDDVEPLLDRCAAFIDRKIADIHQQVPRLPVFFLALFEPSFDYAGLLLDAYAPSAPRAVLRELNRRLAQSVRAHANCYLIDINEIANAVGRMHLQDDSVAGSIHGSLIGEALAELDRDRLVAPTANADLFDYETHSPAFARLFWQRLADSLTILAQTDPIKLIVVDLDDTLWRGVAADGELAPWARIEGWPIGFVEALLFFKRRGGLLAICSKNDRAATLARLPAIWHGALTEADFASIRINWRAKADNIAEILAETNILPDHLLFIDDNPRELAEVAAHFPAIRVLGGRPQDWRRAILCAPETQVAAITPESRRRTELARARVAREAASVAIDRPQWLASLALRQCIEQVADPGAAEALRAVELLNKTNQFNTTGQRWTSAEFHALLAKGGVCLITRLEDRHIDNGIVGVSLIRAGEIVQTVLSCRVFGLGADIVLGSVATRIALQQAPVARGRIVDTGRNHTCHGYYAALGFSGTGPLFEGHQPCERPAWIAVDDRA